MSRTSFLDGTRVVCGLTQQVSQASLGSLEVSACLLDPTRGTRRETRCRVVRVGVMTFRRILGRAIHRPHLHETQCHSPCHDFRRSTLSHRSRPGVTRRG
jgi:hypothetical protein